MDIITEVEEAVRAAIPGSEVAVQGGGGHFIIQVISAEFAGKSRLAKQRLVLNSIKHLMAGPAAPVHAVDKIIALTPDQV